MANITIRTDEDTADKIKSLAEAMDRPRNWIIEDALKQYIADQSWQIEGIKQAQRSLQDGKGTSFDSTVKKLRTRIKRQQKKA